MLITTVSKTGFSKLFLSCACAGVFVYLCVHVCMCACVHVCMCACVHARMRACVHEGGMRMDRWLTFVGPTHRITPIAWSTSVTVCTLHTQTDMFHIIPIPYLLFDLYRCIHKESEISFDGYHVSA